jgi:hypothetical protein
VPGGDSSARVPVHADSEVQVLEGAARVQVGMDRNTVVAFRDEHLRIRIDGREGWIRGPVDFEAIGLPGAG